MIEKKCCQQLEVGRWICYAPEWWRWWWWWWWWASPLGWWSFPFPQCLHTWKLTWQWKRTIFNRRYIFFFPIVTLVLVGMYIYIWIYLVIAKELSLLLVVWPALFMHAMSHIKPHGDEIFNRKHTTPNIEPWKCFFPQKWNLQGPVFPFASERLNGWNHPAFFKGYPTNQWWSQVHTTWTLPTPQVGAPWRKGFERSDQKPRRWGHPTPAAPLVEVCCERFGRVLDQEPFKMRQI